MNAFLKEAYANTEKLELSDKNFKAIFEIMFSNPHYIAAEITEGFRIKKYTYGDIEQKIRKMSAALYNRIGATHGYVALDLDNSVEWIVAFWSILKTGNKPYLVNRRHTPSFSQSILQSLGVKYIVGIGSTALDGVFIDINLLEDGGDFEAEFENELALSTSATTLKKTVCFYTGAEMSCQILNTISLLEKSKAIAAHVDGQIKQLAFLPFYHVFGLIAVYFWFSFYQKTMVFLRDLSGDTITKACRAHGVTHIFAVPLLWHTVEKQILRELENKDLKTQKKFKRASELCLKIQNISPSLGNFLSRKLMTEITEKLFGSTVRFCISGGSYVKDSTLRLFASIGYPLHNGYGMSEVGITSVELNDKPSFLIRNSIGRPFKSVEYRINDRGILQIKGTSTCKRILVDGEMKYLNEWFDTSDIVDEIRGDYYIRGRLGDCVIGENGENINPDTVECVFDIQESAEFSVLGLGTESDETLSMVVRVSPYMSGNRLKKLIEGIYTQNGKLPLAMQIKAFYITNDAIMPETAIKVSRQYLSNEINNGNVVLTPFSNIKFGEEDGFDINSQLADKVRTVIADTLGIEKDHIEGDTHVINDLGATSLQYFSLLTELSKEFPTVKYSDTAGCYYTVRDFCEFIERQI